MRGCILSLCSFRLFVADSASSTSQWNVLEANILKGQWPTLFLQPSRTKRQKKNMPALATVLCVYVLCVYVWCPHSVGCLWHRDVQHLCAPGMPVPAAGRRAAPGATPRLGSAQLGQVGFKCQRGPAAPGPFTIMIGHWLRPPAAPGHVDQHHRAPRSPVRPLAGRPFTSSLARRAPDRIPRTAAGAGFRALAAAAGRPRNAPAAQSRPILGAYRSALPARAHSAEPALWQLPVAVA